MSLIYKGSLHELAWQADHLKVNFYALETLANWASPFNLPVHLVCSVPNGRGYFSLCTSLQTQE